MSDRKLTPSRLNAAYEQARNKLLSERNAAGYWEGELSTSALSTATAVMALEMVRRHRKQDVFEDQPLRPLITDGLRWLITHQNSDGGWGDTLKSFSNISTTMLAHASLTAAASEIDAVDAIQRARHFIDQAGGMAAMKARYGKDHTFSVPIATHCALAGLVDWREITPLPFELACLPARFYKTIRLPVVSYALPALIAIGQARYRHAPPRNPLTRTWRRWALAPSLRVLERIQPPNGGFLEAAPLTSFVTMSLAAAGLADHLVVTRGVRFLIASVRPDGSWPIDTNLATWVTTLAVNALGDDLPQNAREPIAAWLLGQQNQKVHPYTNADPGGWAWTDLPGGVPDADDTPGAILALGIVAQRAKDGDLTLGIPEMASLSRTFAIRWLLGLQNRDGGFPTFCRGWGALPFDRSSADITAHCVRAITLWQKHENPNSKSLPKRAVAAVQSGLRYLARTQRPDGSWLPLWFGNQHAPDDSNPTYGTAKVLLAYRDAGLLTNPAAARGLAWLEQNQNPDGGWGAGRGTPSSVEETALALEAMFSRPAAGNTQIPRGLLWLVEAVETGRWTEPTPIGFYFAKLWYFERLYPLAFTVAALRRAKLCDKIPLSL